MKVKYDGNSSEKVKYDMSPCARRSYSHRYDYAVGVAFKKIYDPKDKIWAKSQDAGWKLFGKQKYHAKDLKVKRKF